MQNKFSNALNNDADDNEIEEEIKDDDKNDQEKGDNNELFAESIIDEKTEDFKFDCFVEKLQEIVIEPEFTKMQNDFMEKYYKEFEDKTENKLCYTNIFKEYTSMTETYIEKNLVKKVPQYKIDDFYKMLKNRKHQIDEQLLDTLLSFTDFQLFKELILEYKARKSHKKDLFSGINIEKVTKQDYGESLDNFDFLNEKYKQSKNKK